MSTVHALRQSQLEVPGATLYFEVRGHGPVLLLIGGGPTDADIFAPVADRLADRYTVVTYDARGNARSRLDGPPAEQSVALEADDAHRLLAAVSSQPAAVFGNSNGAMVGLELVARHPDQVRVLVAHEPPLTGLLPEAAEYRAWASAVQATYRHQGVAAAMASFMAGAGLDRPPADADSPPAPAPPAPPASAAAPAPAAAASPADPQDQARMARSMELFVGYRLQAIASYLPDVIGLRTARPRIVVGVGETSAGQIAHRTSLALAAQLGSQPVAFPGDHGGFLSHPAAFAARLDQVLRVS